MSIQDYMHEKAEESRHNEIIAYMMFLAGSVFFVGGILSSLSMGRVPNWFLFNPYLADYTQMLFSGNRFALDWAIVDFFWHRGRRALLQGQRMVHEGIR